MQVKGRTSVMKCLHYSRWLYPWVKRICIFFLNRFLRLSCLCTLRGLQSRSQVVSSMAPMVPCHLSIVCLCPSSPTSWPGCTLNSLCLYSQVAGCMYICVCMHQDECLVVSVCLASIKWVIPQLSHVILIWLPVKCLVIEWSPPLKTPSLNSCENSSCSLPLQQWSLTSEPEGLTLSLSWTNTLIQNCSELMETEYFNIFPYGRVRLQLPLRLITSFFLSLFSRG